LTAAAAGTSGPQRSINPETGPETGPKTGPKPEFTEKQWMMNVSAPPWDMGQALAGVPAAKPGDHSRPSLFDMAAAAARQQHSRPWDNGMGQVDLPSRLMGSKRLQRGFSPLQQRISDDLAGF